MSQTDSLRPILDVAQDLGIARQFVIPYGDDKAKIRLAARAASGRPPGKLVLVSAITPTSAGEGKTTTSIGLAQGLAKIGQKVCLALREPSLGPVFGVKGGAIGAGRARVEPAADINLHFTGDFHAITSAHNLLGAILDNHIHFDNALEIDPRRVLWRRVIDLNDRALRSIVIGLGGVLQGIPRETGFDITPASEIMAVLCLSEDAEDLRRRLGRILVGLTYEKKPVTAEDLKAVGAMMVLLKDAIQPNLVQTCEGVPAFIHGGPFANIAHGCNSVIATKMAMAHADWTVTEAGFGFDMGAEKFFHVKCTSAGLDTALVVLVATVRALKRHGGVAQADLATPDPAAVERGLGNLRKHIESIKAFTEPPLVAINRFPTDTEEEIAVIRAAAEEMGVPSALYEGVTKGGEGAIELAEKVVANAEKVSSPFRPIYRWSEPIKTKMEKIAQHVYGAAKVSWTREAERDLREIEALGYAGVPLSVAKTQSSLSDDPARYGRPEGFEVTVRQLILAAGAGFVVPLLGDILRMPGLPRIPQSEKIDLVDGKVVGMH